jgi:hypothetical protein
MLREKDQAIWEKALPYLDVRSNDEHSIHSYHLLQRLLAVYPEGNADVLLPAILLHDTGWKQIPAEKTLHAFGPNNKYPELTRQHELEGMAIAEKVLQGLAYPVALIEQVLQLIDGHDTTKHARSLDDSLLKDADKLWRYTPHGVKTIQGWFEIPIAEVLDILEHFVLPGFLTDFGKNAAEVLLAAARTDLQMATLLQPVQNYK